MDQISLALQDGDSHNMKKCEIFTWLPVTKCDIQFKKNVKYLEVVISKNKILTEKPNISDAVDKCKSILDRELQWDVSIFGQVL